MGIIAFIIFGFVVGLIARALLPGRQHMGLLMTTLLGVAGSFLGGAIGALISDRHITDFSTAGLIGSILGAMALLFAVSAMGSRRRMTI